jgi:membrane protease YdiL (CAAX protease family)
MTKQQPSDNWNLRTVCLCLLGTLLATFIILALGSVAGVLWMGYDSFQTFRHSLAARPLYYSGSRLVSLVVCIYFAKVRTRQDFVNSFALHRSTRRFLTLAVMLGIWIAFFVKMVEPAGLATIQFRTYFDVSSFCLLVGPFFEETVMRGFFYPAFRKSSPVVVSIIFVFAIDTMLFHPATFHIPQALVGVCIVDVASCLFREYTKSLWPSTTFHVAYNLPFAVLQWMR